MRLALLAFCCCLFTNLFAQSDCLHGRVLDEQGSPLIGVHILLCGTSTGTVTDLDGRFSLCGLDSTANQSISISYTGYSSQILKTRAVRKSPELQLLPSQALLEEVVVTGYSRSPQIRIGRSVRKLFSRKRKTKDSSNALSARVAPVVVTDRGQPEAYNERTDNDFLPTHAQPVSTLSTDVDRAAYANVRRYLKAGSLPPADAVRTEELINYFAYSDPLPEAGEKIRFNTSVTACPWAEDHQLLRVALRTRSLLETDLPASNLVFLLDVSGSMDHPDKLPLLVESLGLLVDKLREEDRVSIVVYAGAAGLVLPATSGVEREKIKTALQKLSAGGSTAGGAGIELAYRIAKENFLQEGNNRIILATDGDFNVGISDQKKLVELIEEKRRSGIYLTVLGFGSDNYQGGTMQELADRGNGNHAYVDSRAEAKKVLVEEFGGTLFTVATDVKLQLAFDSTKVVSYRLIGYENRLLDEEDFADDKVDAAELGSGHAVTVLYEIVPHARNDEGGGDLAELRLRYKEQVGGDSQLMTHPISARMTAATADDNWAAAVAEFAMLLRKNPHRGNSGYEQCRRLAQSGLGKTPDDYRKEFMKLINRAEQLSAESRR